MFGSVGGLAGCIPCLSRPVVSSLESLSPVSQLSCRPRSHCLSHLHAECFYIDCGGNFDRWQLNVHCQDTPVPLKNSNSSLL